MASAPKTTTPSQPAVYTSPAQDVIEPDPLPESKSSSRKRGVISSSATTEYPRDSGVPSSDPALDMNVQGPSGSDTHGELRSERSLPEATDPQLTSDAEPSNIQSRPTRRQISAFATANMHCNPVHCARAGIGIATLATIFTVTSLVVWLFAYGHQMWWLGVIGVKVNLISIGIIFIGLLMEWYGRKGEEKIRKYLTGEGTLEDVTTWLNFRNPFCCCCHSGRHEIEQDPNSPLLESDDEPEGHHERIKLTKEGRSHRKCLSSLCCHCSADNESQLDYRPSTEAEGEIHD